MRNELEPNQAEPVAKYLINDTFMDYKDGYWLKAYKMAIFLSIQWCIFVTFDLLYVAFFSYFWILGSYICQK